jgi:hypothetical protein
MEPLSLADLAEGALLLIDSPPIIHYLESHPRLAARFEELSEAHRTARVRFAVTTITVAEVRSGPMQRWDEVLARRYRSILESWQVVSISRPTSPRGRTAARAKSLNVLLIRATSARCLVVCAFSQFLKELQQGQPLLF